MREDSEAAGIERETAAGVVDFHALRHTLNTHFARDGVSLGERQSLMRHSDPKLTANVYLHLEVADSRRAVDRLKPLPWDQPAEDDAEAAAGA